MEVKKWWTSKTIWVNVVAIIAVVLNSLYGVEFSAEVQATIATSVLAVVNLILRIITKEPVGR